MATFGVVYINACNDSWCCNDQIQGRTSTMRRRITRVADDEVKVEQRR